MKKLFLKIKQSLTGKLWKQIAAIFIITITVPIVGLGSVLIKTSRQAVKETVLNDYRQIIERASEEISRFIQEPKNILINTAQIIGVTHKDRWKQETVLVEMVLNQPIFINVYSVNISGEIIASSLSEKTPQSSYLQYVTDKTLKTGFYISDLKFLENHIPYVTMALPIKQLGEFTGALIANVDIRGMWNIVDNIKLGKTGKAFLTSSNGTLIAHYDKKKILNNENLSKDIDVARALAGEKNVIENNGWISSYSPIPNTDWIIVLRQSTNEAYMFSKIMKIQSRMIIVIAEIIAIGVSLFIARLMTRPVKKLVARTKQIARGDLDNGLETKRIDEIGGLIRSFNDMSEQLKIAQTRQRLSHIGEAASIIAHELKNSLVAIKTFSQLFPQQHNDEEFVKRFKDIIPEEIERWEHLLSEISDFSKTIKLNLEKVNIIKLLEKTLFLQQDNLVKHNIVLEKNFQQDAVLITVDKEKIQQVFINIIINAVQAMSDGGRLTIGVEDLDDRGINISFTDTGIGITEDKLKKIFEPFTTNKNKGMGIGLTISKRIVEIHGGLISVESEFGKGSTFIIKLPFTPSSVT